MDLVLTLIAASDSAVLDDAVTANAVAALGETGARPGTPDWLAPGEALDLPFTAERPDRIEQSLRAALGQRPLDLAVQPAAGRRKRLLLADMDSTMVTGETLDELADFAGLKPQIAAITARAMAGELDFEAALQTRVGLLKGLPLEALDKALERVTLSPGARSLVATMRSAGAYCALISGGFTQFTGHVREACGFDEARANQLLSADGRLTGAVAEPILGQDAKRSALRELCAERDLDEAAACCVGDGANDIAMLTAAGLGVAYHAKPAVRAAAPFRIDHGDLTALLYLQGFKKADFAA